MVILIYYKNCMKCYFNSAELSQFYFILMWGLNSNLIKTNLDSKSSVLFVLNVYYVIISSNYSIALSDVGIL